MPEEAPLRKYMYQFEGGEIRVSDTPPTDVDRHCAIVMATLWVYEIVVENGEIVMYDLFPAVYPTPAEIEKERVPEAIMDEEPEGPFHASYVITT